MCAFMLIFLEDSKSLLLAVLMSCFVSLSCNTFIQSIAEHENRKENGLFAERGKITPQGGLTTVLECVSAPDTGFAARKGSDSGA